MTCLLMAGFSLTGARRLAAQAGPESEAPERLGTETSARPADPAPGKNRPEKPRPDRNQSEFIEPGADPENKLFLPFLKHTIDDQRAFWTGVKQLREPGDRKAFAAFAGFTGLLVAGDSWISRQVPDSPSQLKRSQDFSNYAAFSLAGAAAGSYALGQLTGNDHLREAGFLSSEAAMNSTAIAYAFKEATGRERPYEGTGNGAFFRGGGSFPSEHAAFAWSVASVMAHEYPGPLSRFLAYGLASAVTITRVTGKEHFSSDAVVGSALGWYLGRQIYRARHDPELGGGAWGSFRHDVLRKHILGKDDSDGDYTDDDNDGAEKPPRAPNNMGSTFVVLDSWVYPAIEKLAALGYVEMAFAGLKPWTRVECAQMTEQAEAALGRDEGGANDLAGLAARLRSEFAYEFGLLDGEPNRTAAVEAVYLRGVSASGPVLNDGYHFGQTMAYDFGRPFERGTNGQAGGSFSAALGPAALFVRAEFQHAPGAPPLSDAARSFIAAADLVPAPSGAAFASVNRVRLLDVYVALKVRAGWQLSFGQQSLDWAPGPGGSFLWSDNAEPIPMVRLLQSDVHLPGWLRFLGPARIENFIGRLGGHSFVPRPYIYGSKINFKPVPNLELGFGRTVTLGGKGGDPFTTGNFLLSFFGRTSHQLNSVPGDSHASFDWTFHVPKLRNYLVFYGDLYADDDPVPFVNLPKNPYRPGIYITRFPRLPKLDFHLEAADSESPGQPRNVGNLNYWNYLYRDGYTSDGNLLGNTVGRMGRTIQGWLTYWISPANTVQLIYKHNSVSPEFVPRGGLWQDYGMRHEIYTPSGLYLKSQVQYEHISRYPLLFPGPERNLTAMVELGFVPQKGK